MRTLKTFGLGILWALVSPVLLLAIVLVGLFGIVDFVIEFAIMVGHFFRGNSLFPTYPEDQRAYEILSEAIAKKRGEVTPATQPTQPQQVFVQQNFYTTPGVPFPQMPNNPAPLSNNANPTMIPPVNENDPSAFIPTRPELSRLPEFDITAEKVSNQEGDEHGE